MIPGPIRRQRQRQAAVELTTEVLDLIRRDRRYLHQIAKAAGLSRYTSKSWPNRPPTLANLMAIADALGCEVVLRRKDGQIVYPRS